MQVILNSNKASNVQNTLTAEGGEVHNLASYVDRSYPNVSKRITEVPPYISFSGAPHSQSQTFNIPQSNFWYASRLKLGYVHTFVDAAANRGTHDWKTPYGLNIINKIDLLSGGQPVHSLTGDALKVLVMNHPSVDFKAYTYRYARPCLATTEELITAAGANTCVSYVPILASWFLTPENALDCSDLDQLQLVVSFKTASEAGLTNTTTSMTGNKLITYKYMTDAETYAKILTENNLNNSMQCFNTFTERQACTGAGVAGAIATTQIMLSNIFYPVYKTHVFVQLTDTTADTNPFVGSPFLKIRNVSVEVGGEQYVANISKSSLNYEQAFHGFGVLSLKENSIDAEFGENAAVVIDWSLLGKNDKNSGLASFKNLNKPVFTITLDALTTVASQNTANYTIFLVHEYWNIIQKDLATKILFVRSNQ